MQPLRRPSARPDLTIDPRAYSIVDPTDRSILGQPGPFGRARCLYTIPVGENPQQWLQPHAAVHDPQGSYLADADGNLVGQGGVWVARMLSAGSVEDTRRIR